MAAGSFLFVFLQAPHMPIREYSHESVGVLHQVKVDYTISL